MGILKDYIEHVSDSFQTLFHLDAVDHLTEAENIERVINHTATVAWVVYALNPFPLLDLATLTPIQAKMTVHIARLKGFEVTPERARETVLEIVGVLGMTLTAQLMITTTAKLVPVVGGFMAGPLVYAATYAIGNVVDYYYDCLRRDQTPSNEAMKDLFVEQFRVGKAKGEKVDRSEIQKKADELRRRVAERDPSLATETRLPPREETLRRGPTTASAPPVAAADGGRRKIKITLGTRATGAAGKSPTDDDEPVAPVRKTIGPTGHVGPEQAATPAKSLGPEPGPALKGLGLEPPPAAKSAGLEPPPAAKSVGPAPSLGEPPPSPKGLGDEPAPAARDPEPAPASPAKSLEPERPPAPTPDAPSSPAKSLEPERPPVPTPDALSQREEDRLGAAPTPARGVTPPPASEAEARAQPAPADAGGAPATKGSIVDQLERLGRLKAQGVLSADEFDQAKRRILGL